MSAVESLSEQFGNIDKNEDGKHTWKEIKMQLEYLLHNWGADESSELGQVTSKIKAIMQQIRGKSAVGKQASADKLVAKKMVELQVSRTDRSDMQTPVSRICA